MTTRKRDTRVRIRDPLRPDVRRSISGTPAQKALAKAHAADMRFKLQHGMMSEAEVRRRMGETLGRPLTLREAWDTYVDAHAHEGTRAGLLAVGRLHLSELMDLPVVDLDEIKLASWAAWMRRSGRGATTVRCTFDWVKAAVTRYVESGRIDRLPWGRYKPPLGEPAERPACRNVRDLERLLLAAQQMDDERRKRPSWRTRDLAIRVLVMALTGLRQGEAAGLAWDCVRNLDPPGHAGPNGTWIYPAGFIERPILIVKYQVRPKWRERHRDWERPKDPVKGVKGTARKGRSHTQVLHPDVVRALRAHREAQKAAGVYREDGPVFPRTSWGSDWRQWPQVIDPPELRECARRAGLPEWERWVVHSLRHSFASLEAVESGGDLKSTSERTGHASLERLAGYLHAASVGLQASSVPVLAPEAVPEPKALPPPEPKSLPPRMKKDAPALAASEGSERTYREIAAEWVARERAGEDTRALEREIEEQQKRAYMRKYQVERRAGGNTEASGGAGRRAKRASKAAWGKALVEARRKAGEGDAAE